MLEDIWITGMGAVTSIGIGVKNFWQAAISGQSGAIRLTHPLLSTGQFNSMIGAPVQNFIPTQHNIPQKDLHLLDPASQYSLAAAYEAILDAGFTVELQNPRKGYHRINEVDPRRLAVVVGSGIGGLATMVDTLVTWYSEHRRAACNRYGLPMLIPNAPAAQIAIRYQARGECKSVSTACAAGTMAIGDGFRLIKDDEADLVICGGAEALLSDAELYGFMGFDLLKTMSRRNDEPTRASRPFDRDRDGFVLSEGSGIVVLERAAHAKARGATPYARVAGYAASCDALSMMQIDDEGLEIDHLIKKALRRADIDESNIDYVSAHGTSTQLNDRVEAAVLGRVFTPGSVVVSALKSMTGHGIGASGAIETMATALAIKHATVPPTINLEHLDPECHLDCVPNQARSMAISAAIKTSYGFGGHNACLVLTGV